MGIGVAVFFIAVGAILTFAVHASVTGVSIQTIGIILMAVGALGLLVSLTIFAPRRHRTVTEEHVDPAATHDRVVERHDVY